MYNLKVTDNDLKVLFCALEDRKTQLSDNIDRAIEKRNVDFEVLCKKSYEEADELLKKISKKIWFTTFSKNNKRSIKK